MTPSMRVSGSLTYPYNCFRTPEPLHIRSNLGPKYMKQQNLQLIKKNLNGNQISTVPLQATARALPATKRTGKGYDTSQTRVCTLLASSSDGSCAWQQERGPSAAVTPTLWIPTSTHTDIRISIGAPQTGRCN